MKADASLDPSLESKVDSIHKQLASMKIASERRVVEYQAVVSEPRDFHKAVNSLIERGWVPQGGMAVTSTDGGLAKIYFQAMVRYA